MARITSAEALAAPLTRSDRLTARFAAFEAPARQLLRAIWQGTSLGEVSGFAFLFDMDDLFEAFVGVELRAALSGTGLSVRLQGPVLPAAREGEHGAFHTKPDAVISNASGHPSLIVDTKWKRLDPGQRHEGVSQADVYQMMAYMAVHTAPAALLLYPQEAFLGESGPRRTYDILGQKASISTATLALSKPISVRTQLRQVVKMVVSTKHDAEPLRPDYIVPASCTRS